MRSSYLLKCQASCDCLVQCVHRIYFGDAFVLSTLVCMKTEHFPVTSSAWGSSECSTQCYHISAWDSSEYPTQCYHMLCGSGLWLWVGFELGVGVPVRPRVRRLNTLVFLLVFNKLGILKFQKSNQIFINSPYFAEACDAFGGPSPRLSAWATSSEETSLRWRVVRDTVSI